ncbi:uncharacterized protein LOC120344960 isoform X1 [Styela clava]
MPVNAYRGSFPTLSAMVKREDENRRASMRAEAKLTQEFLQPGGIDGAKKHSLSVHRREREQVRQELENIKSSFNRNSIIMMQNPDNMKYLNPQLAEDLEEQEFINAQNQQNSRRSGIPKNYGRNYFGYKSQPGSNQPQFQHMKAIKDKYSHVKNYYEYKGPKMMDKKTREKLSKQKQENMSVQERVKSFSLPEKPRSAQIVGYQALSDDTNKTAVKQTNDEEIQKPSIVTEEHKREETQVMVAGLARAKKSSKNTTTEVGNSAEEKPSRESYTLPGLREDEVGEIPLPPSATPSRRMSRIRPSSPVGSYRNFDSGSVIGSTMSLPPYRTSKPKTALDLVFDADTYAPDGRLRTVHCLPNVDKAYKEARQARYVRTKYKREIDRELTVSEIFRR